MSLPAELVVAKKRKSDGKLVQNGRAVVRLVVQELEPCNVLIGCIIYTSPLRRESMQVI